MRTIFDNTLLNLSTAFIVCIIAFNSSMTASVEGGCPCIAEQYKSEKAYPLYKEAALDWRARKWEDAMVKYHQVIEKDPSSPLAAKSHMGIGLYLKFLKYYDEAIPEFRKGISMIPETRSARDAKTSIACIHTLQGKYEDALNILRGVLAEAKDWDQVKYCSYWMKEICRLKAHGYPELKACGPKVLATVLRLKGIKCSKKELWFCKMGLFQEFQGVIIIPGMMLNRFMMISF